MLLLNRNRLQNWKKKKFVLSRNTFHLPNMFHISYLNYFILYSCETLINKRSKICHSSRLWGVGSDIFFEFNIILQWFCCLHASLCAFITFSARKKIKLLTRCPGCPSVLCACACVCVCVPARISICVLAVFVPCEWSVCKCTNPLPFVSLVF